MKSIKPSWSFRFPIHFILSPQFGLQTSKFVVQFQIIFCSVFLTDQSCVADLVDLAVDPAVLAVDPADLVVLAAGLVDLVADPAALVADPAGLVADPAALAADLAALGADLVTMLALEDGFKYKTEKVL
nr:uncharacterized protein LOC108129320 [Drosophila bipectinata]